MRALVQRVHEGWVTSSEVRGGAAEETGRIGQGLVVLVGVTHDDDERTAERMADKIYNLRVFADEQGAMNLSCEDVGGQLLVVSQFTLYADTSRGRRPSYLPAAQPDQAEPLVERLVARLRELGAVVATGRFRTHMDVGIVNDGPVTILLEL